MKPTSRFLTDRWLSLPPTYCSQCGSVDRGLWDSLTFVRPDTTTTKNRSGSSGSVCGTVSSSQVSLDRFRHRLLTKNCSCCIPSGICFSLLLHICHQNMPYLRQVPAAFPHEPDNLVSPGILPIGIAGLFFPLHRLPCEKMPYVRQVRNAGP
jgi:hypothetical protein